MILNNKADDVLFQIYDENLENRCSYIKYQVQKGAVRYNDNTYFNVELKADMIIGEIEKERKIN